VANFVEKSKSTVWGKYSYASSGQHSLAEGVQTYSTSVKATELVCFCNERMSAWGEWILNSRSVECLQAEKSRKTYPLSYIELPTFLLTKKHVCGAPADLAPLSNYVHGQVQFHLATGSLKSNRRIASQISHGVDADDERGPKLNDCCGHIWCAWALGRLYFDTHCPAFPASPPPPAMATGDANVATAGDCGR